MPALHCAITRSGFWMMKSGAPKAGIRKPCNNGGSAIWSSYRFASHAVLSLTRGYRAFDGRPYIAFHHVDGQMSESLPCTKESRPACGNAAAYAERQPVGIWRKTRRAEPQDHRTEPRACPASPAKSDCCHSVTTGKDRHPNCLRAPDSVTDRAYQGCELNQSSTSLRT